MTLYSCKACNSLYFSLNKCNMASNLIKICDLEAKMLNCAWNVTKLAIFVLFCVYYASDNCYAAKADNTSSQDSF